MRNRSTARFINGIVSAIVVCLFLAHAIVGSLLPFVALPHLPLWLLWAGIVAVAIHVLLCVATSYEQLTDTVRPPSSKKKQHLVLKWVTGCILAALAAFHIIRIQDVGPAAALHSPLGTAATIALVGALTSHIWTGSKSLLKDLNIDRRFRNALRVTVCIIAAVIIIAALLSITG